MTPKIKQAIRPHIIIIANLSKRSPVKVMMIETVDMNPKTIIAAKVARTYAMATEIGSTRARGTPLITTVCELARKGTPVVSVLPVHVKCDDSSGQIGRNWNMANLVTIGVLPTTFTRPYQSVPTVTLVIGSPYSSLRHNVTNHSAATSDCSIESARLRGSRALPCYPAAIAGTVS